MSSRLERVFYIYKRYWEWYPGYVDVPRGTPNNVYLYEYINDREPNSGLEILTHKDIT